MDVWGDEVEGDGRVEEGEEGGGVYAVPGTAPADALRKKASQDCKEIEFLHIHQFTFQTEFQIYYKN